ncbi:MAG: tetratricopeptide repeat protein, partial [Candidatus Omnitrophota bacterium]
RDHDTLKYYKMALDMSPDSALVHFYLGAYYDKIKERFLAVSELRQAIKLDPKFSDAYNYLGYMYAEQGSNLDEAIVLIKKAIELEPDNGAYIDSLGWAYFQDGMTDEALTELEKAVKLEPDDPTVCDHLGDVYFKKSFKDKARAQWERSLKLDPKQDKVREKLRKKR